MPRCPRSLHARYRAWATQDGRRGLGALTYRNTVEIDYRAVPRGEDPPPASSWQRHLAETGRGRDAASARQAMLPKADLKRLLGS